MKGQMMNRTTLVTLGILLTALAFSCGKKGTEPQGPPVPTIVDGPRALDVRTTSAQIVWKTDVISNSVVYYGTQSATYTDSVVDALQDTLHSVNLTNLQSNTTYYYAVVSANESGKTQSGEHQFTTAMSFSDLVEAGWDAYEKGQIAQAAAYFREVIRKNHFWADGYNGLGWCLASSVLDSLDAAAENFSSAIYYGPDLAEAYAGRGFVYLAQKRYGMAIEDFSECLKKQPDFVFSHNPSITSKDVHLGLAECYYFRQQFSLAQQEVDILEPDNGLSPDDSSTWTVDGTSYSSYEAALLAWIEKLKSVVS